MRAVAQEGGAYSHDHTWATDMEGSPVFSASTASWAPVVRPLARPAGGSAKVKTAVHLRRPLAAGSNVRDVPAVMRLFGLEAPAAGQRTHRVTVDTTMFSQAMR